MLSFFNYSAKTLEIAKSADEMISSVFTDIDRICQYNSEKVLAAFQKNRVSEACFAGTTGYGYDDMGRERLGQVCADIFQTEDALMRVNFVNGTHTIACALFGALRPGDTLLSLVGPPYDTLLSVIGVTGNYPGSLKDFGIKYDYVPVTDQGLPDLAQIRLQAPEADTVLIQRSRGYSSRKSLTVSEIGEIIDIVKNVNPKAKILVDNCYGEFVETIEPSQAGADLIMGSLIKNPGGGIAPTGGYIAGRHDLVEAAAMRMTTPGIGRECGATLNTNRLLYQGLFLAPHTVAQALKTAVFCAASMEELGYKTLPSAKDPRADIVQLIEFGHPETLAKFCAGIQKGAPVDSYVTPEFWDMPGYDVPVIMAAGAFISGASIELSADGPKREPYAAYMQGGLTYESGRTGILLAIEELIEGNDYGTV